MPKRKPSPMMTVFVSEEEAEVLSFMFEELTKGEVIVKEEPFTIEELWLWSISPEDLEFTVINHKEEMEK